MRLLITVLMSVAVAFPAGWLLCRVWLTAAGGGSITRDRHHALLKAQRSRYRQRIEQMLSLVRRHEATRDQVRRKVADLQAGIDSLTGELADRDEAISALRREIVDARQHGTALEKALSEARSAGAEAVEEASRQDLNLLQIERDELRARIRRLEQESATRVASDAEAADAEAAARATRGELRDRLASSEHRVKQLEHSLAERDREIEVLREQAESWKHRLEPLTRQLQKQRELIRHGTVATKEHAEPAQRDELQKIRGIGPALERRLRAQGIHTFAQLASMSSEDLEHLADRLAIAPSLPRRDEWVRQARELGGFPADPDPPAMEAGDSAAA